VPESKHLNHSQQLSIQTEHLTSRNDRSRSNLCLDSTQSHTCRAEKESSRALPLRLWTCAGPTVTWHERRGCWRRRRRRRGGGGSCRVRLPSCNCCGAKRLAKAKRAERSDANALADFDSLTRQHLAASCVFVLCAACNLAFLNPDDCKRTLTAAFVVSHRPSAACAFPCWPAGYGLGGSSSCPQCVRLVTRLWRW
jgi:hypothetical protein